MSVQATHATTLLWGVRQDESPKGLNLENIRYCSIVAFCLLLAACAAEVSTTEPGPEVTTQPEVSVPPVSSSDIEILSPPVQEPDPVDDVVVVEEFVEPLPSAWELIRSAQDDVAGRNSQLLQAVAHLIVTGRLHEAAEIFHQIDTDQLSDVERVDAQIIEVRLDQAFAEHPRALRTLNRLSRAGPVTFEQRIRIARLKAYSHSVVGQTVEVAIDLAELFMLLSDDREEQLKVGHQLWRALSTMTVEELRSALNQANDPVTRQWFVLALGLGLNSVRVDPHKYMQAIQNWQRENPEHPANGLIEAGLAPHSASYSKLALLLPLSSVNHTSVKALLDGFLAQHNVNSDPQKPEITVIDVGDQPENVTQFYYQAIGGGADLVIGPLGVGFVSEMAKFADFIVPTLLLGEVDKIHLPDYVYQFALAPEHEGDAVARRARQDGHVTALVIKSPQSWSERTVNAFSEKWSNLGGHLLEVYDYELGRSDYSEAAKKILLIDSSASRYQVIRELMGQAVKFVPRRRQDADFIFLSADSEHGRLLKPYLDFLKAHDLPIYSTSHIYTGRINKVRDQDLNGVQFADMEWVLDRSDRMQELKASLRGDQANLEKYDRLFAMGIDIYNLVFRMDALASDAASRFHGVTSMIRLTDNGRLLRDSRWAVFKEGVPELVPGLPDPELGSIPILNPDVLVVPLGERPQ